jgi:ubiquinone/menaquinone biosynthesis C-methylase UbiE
MPFWGIYSHFYSLSLANLFPYRSLLEELNNMLNIRERESILDAGCGPGLVIEKILKENRGRQISITGIDIDRRMIGYAHTRCMKLSNVRLQIADLNRSLEFPDNSFDKVICSNTLYALEQPGAAISEFHRVLKPGGAVVIANPKPNAGEGALIREHISALNRLTPLDKKIHHILVSLLLIPVNSIVITINRITVEKGRRGRYHFLTEEDLQRTLQDVGFINIQTRSCYADQNWLVTAQKTEVRLKGGTITAR